MIIRQRYEIVAIPAQFAHLPAPCAVTQSVDRLAPVLHKPLLYFAGGRQLVTGFHCDCIARHIPTSVRTSIHDARNLHSGAAIYFLINSLPRCREYVACSDYPMTAQKSAHNWKE